MFTGLVLVLTLTLWVLTAAMFYQASVAALRLTGTIPGLGRICSVTRSKGTDTFKFSLGSLFAWIVSVNRQKGTLTGSIQIDSAKRRGRFGCLVAWLAAVAVPLIASVMMPAALVAVGLALAGRPSNDLRH